MAGKCRFVHPKEFFDTKSKLIYFCLHVFCKKIVSLQQFYFNLTKMEANNEPQKPQRTYRCNDCGGVIYRHEVFCSKCGKLLDRYDFDE